jgi:hypothetical protein
MDDKCDFSSQLKPDSQESLAARLRHEGNKMPTNAADIINQGKATATIPTLRPSRQELICTNNSDRKTR